jgi:hypothetical protein
VSLVQFFLLVRRGGFRLVDYEDHERGEDDQADDPGGQAQQRGE